MYLLKISVVLQKCMVLKNIGGTGGDGEHILRQNTIDILSDSNLEDSI